MRFMRNGKWLSAAMGEESAMMSIETGNYVTLSRVGTRIWELLEAPIAAPALCDRLVAEYDVPADVCRVEVDQFLEDLRAANAIVVEPASSPGA
ncbi:MAG: PqqD family protein [Caulobacteraceae bacterium]|nr:PqqD family protein [Caulobacteraceae bacterium]